MSREKIYSTKIKYKGRFNIKEIYEKLHKLLLAYNWEALPGKDYFETYYYHKITPDSLHFIEIKWEAKKNFRKEEPKIDWYLTLILRVNVYNMQNQAGELEIELKTEHEIEEIKEPEIKTKTESYLVKIFKIYPNWLKSVWEKVRIIGYGNIKLSAKHLYIESEQLKKEILNMIHALSY